MKHKFKFLFAVIIGLTVMSCQSEEFDGTNEISPSISESPSLRSADGKYRFLGFSYDVTGENLARESLRRPVIDIDRLAAETKHTIILNPETGGKDYFYYGYSSLDYIKEINRKSGFSATASGIDFDKLMLCGFGGNINYNTEFESKYSYSSKYSFASVDIVKFVESYNIAETSEFLTKFVTEKFLSDLNKTTPDQFVIDYGTHVLTDMIMGGHLRITYRSSIIEESNYTRKKEIVKAGLNGTLKSIGLTANVDTDSEIKETLTTMNKEKTLFVDYKAGEGIGGVYNLETDNITINLGTWQASVNRQNAGLVKINWSKAYPIYDFITDPVKKAQIKDAVIRYVKSKQLEVLEITPLFRVHNHKRGNTFTVLGQEELNSWLRQGSHYLRDGQIGFVPSKRINNTVPLYRVHNNKNGNTFTVFGDGELNSWLRQSKYIYDGQTGYVYSKQEPNTIPLYRVHNKKRGNTFSVLGNDELNYWLRQGSHYVYDGQTGYVYPN